MSLLTTLLDIDAIECEIPISTFDPGQIERLAHAILASQGLINPILVREINPIKFSVIEGAFEYYAAVKASEIDHLFAEIRAIVVPNDRRESIFDQVQILRKGSNKSSSESVSSDTKMIEMFIRQQMTLLKEEILLNREALKIEIKAQNSYLDSLEKKVTPSSIEIKKKLIHDLNSLDEKEIEAKLKELQSKRLLSNRSKGTKNLSETLKKISQERPFSRVKDIERVGFTANDILCLIDNWN